MKLVAVIVILACTIVASADGASTQRRTGLIRVFAITQREVNDGRMRLVVKRVRDRHARSIGSVGQVCTRLPASTFDRHPRSSCVGTLVMPLGRIMYSGLRHKANYYVLAVIGGTGAYAGATGTLAARTITTGPRVEWLLVSLV